MVADLLQLHDGVHQGLCTSFALKKFIIKIKVNVSWRIKALFFLP